MLDIALIKVSILLIVKDMAKKITIKETISVFSENNK